MWVLVRKDVMKGEVVNRLRERWVELCRDIGMKDERRRKEGSTRHHLMGGRGYDGMMGGRPDWKA